MRCGAAAARVDGYDWSALASGLDQVGAAVLPKLLTSEECGMIAALYPHEEQFRSHIVMARHGFGKGEYRYFRYPLPGLVGGLRTALYPPPRADREPLERAHGHRHALSGRARPVPRAVPRRRPARPTPLLLQYVAGDYNCLHQDLYGELVVPAAGGDPALGAGPRLHRRRIRPDRAAAAHAVAGPRSCRSGKATRVAFAVHHRPVRARAASIASTCATASAASAAAGVTRSASSSTTPPRASHPAISGLPPMGRMLLQS